MNISLIGAGEVGRTWAQAFTGIGNGTDALTVIDPRPPATTVEWAERAGLAIHSDFSVLPESGLVLLFVPGTLQPQVVGALVEHLRPGMILVDLTTASPEAKHDAASLLAERKIGYVDVAIVGIVAQSGVRTPLLIASEPVDLLEPVLATLDVPHTYLPGARPGDAVRVKLLRSVLTKGIEALAVEVLPAARAHGLLDQLFVALGDIDAAPFESLLRSLIVSHAGHASRRDAEIRESIRLLEAVGGTSKMAHAVSERYNDTMRATAEHGHRPGASFEDALTDLAPGLLSPSH